MAFLQQAGRTSFKLCALSTNRQIAATYLQTSQRYSSSHDKKLHDAKETIKDEAKLKVKEAVDGAKAKLSSAAETGKKDASWAASKLKEGMKSAAEAVKGKVHSAADSVKKATK